MTDAELAHLRSLLLEKNVESTRQLMPHASKGRPDANEVANAMLIKQLASQAGLLVQQEASIADLRTHLERAIGNTHTLVSIVEELNRKVEAHADIVLLVCTRVDDLHKRVFDLEGK